MKNRTTNSSSSSPGDVCGRLRLLHGQSFLRLWLLLFVMGALLFSFASPLPLANAQRRGRAERTSPANDPPPTLEATPRVSREAIDGAMAFICSDRGRDPLGSLPIDVMQARPSLERNHPEAIVGARRAQNLLPLAKDLVIEALQKLAAAEGLPAWRVRSAAARVRMVSTVVPDPDLRDNAAVMMSDQRKIHFGTIFLVGLPSDEGMISVLAHELTHIADGRENSLQPLFNKIGLRASDRTGMNINGQQPEELTCDLVGVYASLSLIARTPDKEPTARRFARALEHNCVDNDDTDEEHLSPRSTMRALLALEPALTRGIKSPALR